MGIYLFGAIVGGSVALVLLDAVRSRRDRRQRH